MSTINRYLFRQTAAAMLLVLLSLTAILWIGLALRTLNVVTEQGQNAQRMIAMTSLGVPTLLAVIAPFALLIACLHVLNKLNGDSELIIMAAGGMPVWSLMRPFALLAFLVALGLAGVNNFLHPWSQRRLSEYTALLRTELITQVLQPWQFIRMERNLTIHIRDWARSGEMLGLLIHDAREPKTIVTYLAERALIIKQGDLTYLRMSQGHIVRRIDNEPAPQIIKFDTYVLDATKLGQGNQIPAAFESPRELFTPQLLRPNMNHWKLKELPGWYAQELHDRLSSPGYAFVFMLLALVFMGRPRTTRQAQVKAIVAAFAIAVGCRILGFVASNNVAIRPSAGWVLYAIPMGLALISIVAMQYLVYPRRWPQLGRTARSEHRGPANA
jgi:lipopolysaccharide export system permease protein